MSKNEQTITIVLSPYDALNILTLLKAYGDDLQHPQMEAILKSVISFETQIEKKMSHEQIDDAEAERSVNRLLDKEPW